jgi:hypothetical protein
MCKPINQSSSARGLHIHKLISNAEQTSEPENSISRDQVLQLRGKQLTAESSPQMSIAIKEGRARTAAGVRVSVAQSPGPVFQSSLDPMKLCSIARLMKDDLSS